MTNKHEEQMGMINTTINNDDNGNDIILFMESIVEHNIVQKIW